MLGTLGWQELLLIGLILALLLGASRVSEMGRGLGAAVREFRRGVSEPGPEAHQTASPKAPPAPPGDAAEADAEREAPDQSSEASS